MRDWETRCKEAGAVLICESVICNEMPDDEGIQSCKALGEIWINKYWGMLREKILIS